MTTLPTQINPIVAPDASRVAYTTGTLGWVVTTDGGVPRRLCEDCVVLAWLRDASRVLIASPYPNSVRARALRLDDGGEEEVLPPGIAAGRLDPSPDGRWLAFTTRPNRIWIAPLRPYARAVHRQRTSGTPWTWPARNR